MNYPFGEKVRKVEQKDRTQKECFILGVYASAVHAKWIGPDNKEKVKALAVASEPEIFWKGDPKEAAEIISKIKIPSGVGRLEVASQTYNGPSGSVLDECYLRPLGLTRDDVWLCDLLPYSRLNPEQLSAIKREYEPLENKFNLPKVTIEKVPTRFCDEARRNEIVEELKESGAKKIILLGDIPIKEFADYFLTPKRRKLSAFEEYGVFHDIQIENETYQILPLVHPRQAGKLGRASHSWFNKHQDWIARKVKERERS
jgi:uracil-DNA glycosylase